MDYSAALRTIACAKLDDENDVDEEYLLENEGNIYNLQGEFVRTKSEVTDSYNGCKLWLASTALEVVLSVLLNRCAPDARNLGGGTLARLNP